MVIQLLALMYVYELGQSVIKTNFKRLRNRRACCEIKVVPKQHTD